MRKNDTYRMSRRTFLKTVGATAGALAFTRLTGKLITPALAQIPQPQVPLPGRIIPKYVDPLPIPARIDATGGGLYAITMSEFQQQVLPAIMYPPAYAAGTYVWGYGLGGPAYPGPTIVAQRGVPLDIRWVNNLANSVILQPLLKVDQTLHWADPKPPMNMPHYCMMSIVPGQPPTSPCDLAYAGPVPTVVHVHGAEVESASDGHPEAWFTPGFGIKGPAWVHETYHYANGQEGTTLWYHDHTLGVTRLNVYSGLAGFYLLRDPAIERPDLPGGPPDDPKYEVEIVIQDRMFDTNGQWFFPSIGINPEHPFWIPEFLGDAIVVNGKTWPYLNVDPRRYRFRFLNGSNARFYSMRLMDPVSGLPGPPIWQIGTDGGLLNAPAQIAFPKELLLGPGERADVIIDFTAITPGTEFILYNSARAPYPKGAPVDPNTTGQIMKFVVGPGPVADPSYNPATGASPRLTPMVRLAPTVTPPGIPDVTRQLTLNEVMGPGGPLEVLLNNTKWDGTMSGLPAPGITEMPRVGSTEVWEIINLTADAHPIHLHLVQFQLLNRQPFQTNKYLKAYDAAFGGVYLPASGPPNPYGTPNTDGAVGGNPPVSPYLQGKPRLPAASEDGWKDTVIMYPGEVTRIVVRWAILDALAGSTSPGANTYPFDPRDGPGYVWHCHILDHEDNEMMRPYQVAS